MNVKILEEGGIIMEKGREDLYNREKI